MPIDQAYIHSTCGSFGKTSHLNISNFYSVTYYTVLDSGGQILAV